MPPQFVIFLEIWYYAFLCVITFLVTVNLRINNTKVRVALIFVAPLVGIGVGYLEHESGRWAPTNDLPFFVLSVLPTVGLGIWAKCQKPSERENDV